MFDDQPSQINQKNTIPPNLPLSEPEDIFGSQGDASAPVETNRVAQREQISDPTQPPTALAAGVLKPKVQAQEGMQQGSGSSSIGRSEESRAEEAQDISSPRMEARQDVYKIKEPSFSRGLLTVVIIFIIVGILGGGGWWISRTFIYRDTTDLPSLPQVEETTSPGDIDFSAPPQEGGTTAQNGEADDTNPQDRDSEALFGEPIDRDGDGLDDVRERDLGTDPEDWDSDNDGLSDGDEVIIWKTDPLNPDSDGDTYLDGMEIKSGYSPTGAGKLFQPPTSSDQGNVDREFSPSQTEVQANGVLTP